MRLPTGLIVTDVTFAGIRLLKGSAGREIILRFLGGTVGDEVLEVADWPRLDVGQAYLVFTKDNGRSIFPVVGGDQTSSASSCTSSATPPVSITPTTPASA